MITIDDKYRFEDFGLIGEPDHDIPATPDFYRKTVHIPSRPGEWDFGVEVREKPLGFNITTLNIDRIDMEHRLNKFKRILFDEWGHPKLIKIVYDYEPDKFYMVKVASSFSPHRIKPFSYWFLPFVAHDPYKYSNVFADDVFWGSEDITFESDYLLGHTNDFGGEPIHITSPRIVNITTSGLAVQPTIYIEGSANNLTLSVNGHSFSLPNFSNTKWEIDFNRYVVFKDGQETMEEIWDFYLMPGNNKVAVTGSNLNIYLKLKFRDKYN